jgi:hypothetical protein
LAEENRLLRTAEQMPYLRTRWRIEGTDLDHRKTSQNAVYRTTVPTDTSVFVFHLQVTRSGAASGRLNNDPCIRLKFEFDIRPHYADGALAFTSNRRR